MTNCWELANSEHFNDTGLNTWTFRNEDSNATALITGFKIVRNYGMVNMDNQPCSDDYIEPASNGTIDGWREDYACNWENCGGLSYTSIGNSGANNDQSISIPGSFSWSFTCPVGDPTTYVGPRDDLLFRKSRTLHRSVLPSGRELTPHGGKSQWQVNAPKPDRTARIRMKPTSI